MVLLAALLVVAAAIDKNSGAKMQLDIAERKQVSGLRDEADGDAGASLTGTVDFSTTLSLVGRCKGEDLSCPAGSTAASTPTECIEGLTEASKEAGLPYMESWRRRTGRRTVLRS